ncbi:MAG: DNA primase [Gammaproteobacteria bacterium]|nr:DNA primase [Gammaproteobacteria bacterium]
MAGKIPNTFIDDLIARVDIVDIIDRRVPLIRKGKEYQACCPFHEEKTPSFTVSPSKQFYHCFGCGAHGTVIGFLMDYANLSFVEAIEELADGMGITVPREDSGSRGSNTAPQEATGELLRIVEQASYWFQQQLRNDDGGKKAIEYLKKRGLDGRIAASFGIGYAPNSWNGLAGALGTSAQNQQFLLKAGLVSQKENSPEAAYYDRFRGRVMFPIEDHRGRTVAFGGRILDQGEPKYLNSPETSLFHKGAELYGLHRARRAIDAESRSIVVEGYMDVISLAQFGVDNAVATLGTATTRTHLQRLFRLAPEIVFCFDGDRAGRSAAWKAMVIALPEMQDGRLTGFLFLPDGEDPDSWIRNHGKEGFNQQLDQAISLPEFLFDGLTRQVDMARMEGKARLVSLAKPLLAQLPQGALKEIMFARLSSLSGLSAGQLGSDQSLQKAQNTHNRNRDANLPEGQLSPLALATSLLLQNPELGKTISNIDDLRSLNIKGANILLAMIDASLNTQEQTTARLLESFRESEFHSYLEKLAGRSHFVDDQSLELYFNDTLDRLLYQQKEQHRLVLLEKSRQGTLAPGEKEQLVKLLQTRVVDRE